MIRSTTPHSGFRHISSEARTPGRKDLQYDHTDTLALNSSSPPRLISPKVPAQVPLPDTLDLFFGPGNQVAQIRPFPPSDSAPRGGWEIHIPNPANPGLKEVTFYLRNHKDTGFVIDDEALQNKPFSSWKRMEQGWLGETPTAVSRPLAKASDLVVFLSDYGEIQLNLHEIGNDGKGRIYSLDPIAFQKDPTSTPSVLEKYQYDLGAVPQPPFPFAMEPKPEIPSLTQFFGGDAQRAEFNRLPIGPTSPKGGWSVLIPNPNDPLLANVELLLRDHKEMGSVNECTSQGVKEFPFGSWVRTEKGWVNETRSRLTPETFGVVSTSKLETALSDFGKNRMVLTLDMETGQKKVYEFDFVAFQKDPTKPPPVIKSP